jgi:hypothetical protein
MREGLRDPERVGPVPAPAPTGRRELGADAFAAAALEVIAATAAATRPGFGPFVLVAGATFVLAAAVAPGPLFVLGAAAVFVLATAALLALVAAAAAAALSRIELVRAMEFRFGS